MPLPFAQWPARVGQIKTVSFLKRRQDLSLEDFRQHWRTTHRQHAEKLISAGYLQGYVQNHPVDKQLDDLEHFDGSPEIWINDIHDLTRLANSREYLEGAALDEPNFLELPVYSAVMNVSACGRQQIVPDAPIKLMLSFSTYEPDAQQAFIENWRAFKSASVLTDQEPLAWVRHETPKAFWADSPFLAVESSWWRSWQELQQAWAARTLPIWVKNSHIRGLVAREHWVKPFD